MVSKLRAKVPDVIKPGRAKIMVFAEPGAGKSFFSTGFPRPYYLDTEGGARLGHYVDRIKAAGGVYLGKDEGAGDFDTILEQVEALATEKHDYRTLVIDSLTKPYWNAIAGEQERMAREGDKDAFGASKKPAVSRMRRLQTWLDRLDMNVVLVCHESAKWETNSKGDREETGRQPDVWDKWSYELDLVLRIVKLGKGIREAIVTKSRLRGFPEFERFYLQQNGQDVGYANFLERFKQDYPDAAQSIAAESKPVVLATPDEVAEIMRLLEIVKIPEETQSKWFAKAGVDSFAEFTHEQAAGVLSLLNSKLTSSVKKAS